MRYQNKHIDNYIIHKCKLLGNEYISYTLAPRDSKFRNGEIDQFWDTIVEFDNSLWLLGETGPFCCPEQGYEVIIKIKMCPLCGYQPRKKENK